MTLPPADALVQLNARTTSPVFVVAKAGAVPSQLTTVLLPLAGTTPPAGMVGLEVKINSF